MTPKEILKLIGLTEKQLRDYLKRMDRLFRRMSKKEQRVFLAGKRACDKAAVRSFRGEITAAELEEFIRSREPKNAQAVFLLHKACDGGEDDDSKKPER